MAHFREFDCEKQPLAEHLVSVAELSESFAGKIGLAELGHLVGLLHDLGKYSSEFQIYLMSAVGLLNFDEDEEYVDAKGLKGKIDHSSAGAQLVWRELSKRGRQSSYVGQILALCILSHHSGLIDCLTLVSGKPVVNTFSKRINKTEERTHLLESFEKSDSSIRNRIDELLNKPDLEKSLVTIITNICKLEQNHENSLFIVNLKVNFLIRYLYSCLIDADRINSAEFEDPQLITLRNNSRFDSWDELISRLEGKLSSFKQKSRIDYIRRDISNNSVKAASSDKGLFTLTVPTGGGKTLTSLRFALHHARNCKMDRIVYVIPYTTIIDQNANEVRKILEPAGIEPGRIVLEHHSNLKPETETWRTKRISENWNAKVVFTTSVQFLETLFGSGTRGARRMHQLANSVLIFDEIQSLPVKCIHLFNNAINFLVEQCNCTVIMCSATQPLLDKVNKNKGALRVSVGAEIIPDVSILFEDLKRVELLDLRKPGGWSLEEVISLALAEVKKSGSCLVVVNTKKDAQLLYRLIENSERISTFHMSTNMCPTHRMSILVKVKKLLSQNRPTICISTQLIESGIDIDFGSVVRFLAGLDSIAQAAGRCNRSGSKKVGFVHVVNPKDENLSMLEEIKVGCENAQQVLDEYADDPEKFDYNPIGPKAMEFYYKNYFFNRSEKMDYPIPAEIYGRDDTLINLLSINSKVVEEYKREYKNPPEINLHQSFMSAAKAFKVIDTPTQGVIIPYGKKGRAVVNELCSTNQPKRELDLLRQAQHFSVNVLPTKLVQYFDNDIIDEVKEGVGILYLRDLRYYSSAFGLCDKPTGEKEVLNG
ncbi:MAG: CRISPR-associated helicase Cas3' [Magnetococcales bacterium]|nr:CRISPR-associated helicase Cas3' [Magnetococcales bacterium]